MKFSTRHVLVPATLLLAFTGIFGVALAADGTSTQKAQSTKQSWAASGGTVGVRWNRDLAGDVGLKIATPTGKLAGLSWREHERFDLRRTGSLEFTVSDGNLQAFVDGSLQARGGYVVKTAHGDINLTDFRLRPRANDPLILEMVGADGKVWFYVDRVMYEIVDNDQTLAVRAMDLRISPQLATRIDHPEVANWVIADLEMSTDVLRQGSGTKAVEGGGVYDWAGTPAVRPPGEPQPPPGAINEADLFMQTFSPQYSRCNGCNGSSSTSQLVFTPSSTLKNNVNNGAAVATIPGDPLGTSTALWTADIPWYQKFTSPSAPYNNDQHPYLIWNLYRFNVDGSIEQIGRSGAKHAFLTTNQGCASGHGTNSHVLGRQCGDTYGTSNNDSNSDLGPRSEIIPATNQWSRCFSIYDTNCDGVANSSGNGNYSQRMIVAESQINATSQPGATYKFESWYLAREDVNIYNSMATKRVIPNWSGSVWSLGGNDQYFLGPAIDRWVDPTNPPANAKSAEIANSEGHTKVAVKATDLGGGNWRYDYAVMNLDFARALIDPAHATEPNLHIFHNFGFDRFRVLIAPSVNVSTIVFSDGDTDPSNDWVGTVDNGPITWTAPVNPSPVANVPPVLNPLNWGTLYKFSFVANAAPIAITTSLHVAQEGDPVSYEAVVLGPSSDEVLASSFDSAVPTSATPVSLDWTK